LSHSDFYPDVFRETDIQISMEYEAGLLRHLGHELGNNLIKIIGTYEVVIWRLLALYIACVTS
jgi:hypothetical protein